MAMGDLTYGATVGPGGPSMAAIRIGPGGPSTTTYSAADGSGNLFWHGGTICGITTQCKELVAVMLAFCEQKTSY